MTTTPEEKALTLGMERQIIVSPDQMAVIKSTIFPESTDDELKLFIYHCQRKGVHPMDKLIHPIKRGGKVAFQASIDYLRAESESAGDYRGMKQPVYEFDEQGRLESATVTVLREINGVEIEFTATAFWTEYYPGEKLGFMWDKMPRHMLAKCAEALARRQAWPKKLADLYTQEEMAQADNSNTASQNRQQSRSASVKPAPAARPQSSHQLQATDAEYSETSIDDQIEQALAEIADGDYQAMCELLKECSEFPGKDGKKLHIKYDQLSKVGIDWKKKAWAKLNKKLEEHRAGMAGEFEREPGAEG
ncbi:MAG: hypothetical protein FD174_2608 [Geobacteraceae bacterium]|nr:MAG: hypothetical protein FD174_2608 [Geobacteraceae bacterium]